jgi:hypothetical protein
MIPLPLLAFFSTIKKALAIARDLANAVPGWIWALALVVVAVSGMSARSQLADLRKDHADLVAAVDAQKAQAAAQLANAQAQVKALQDSLQQSAKAKDAQDVNTQNQIAALAGQLRHARIDGRLRDPNASGPSGANACTGSAQGSATGDADGAQTGGLLSKPLTELLTELTLDADTINAAYARCREDARELRQKYNAWRASQSEIAPD